MKKKIYYQPIVEATTLTPNTFVMITVSEGGDPPGGGAHAPKKGTSIP